MATLAELEDALRNADAAGDSAAATALADEIVRMQSQPTTAEAPAQLPVDTPERRALQAELNSRLASADAAGRSLARAEQVNSVARPVLRGAVDLADGITALPRLLATAPVAGINALAGTNIPLPINQSVADIADVARGSVGLSADSRQRLAPQNDSEALASTITQGLGGVLGGVGIGGLLGAGAGAGSAVGNVGRVLASNPGLQTAGAVTGGLAGEAARQAGGGAVSQTVASLAGSLVPGAAVGAANKFATGASRTPEAQRLLARGVDLTPGQLNPSGRVNQLEEGTSSIGLVGPTIRAGRDNARNTFQRAVIQEGAAPGTTIKQADPAQMLDEAYESFRPLYDEAKGFPASPQIVNQGANVPLSSALRSAVRNGGILATDDQRKAVLKFLKSQLTKGVTTSDDLLNIRRTLRDEGRKALKANNTERADLLAAAEDKITLSLESQLPAAPLRALKTADSKYGDYKIVEGAVARSKERPGGFTANDLSESVFAATGQGALRGSYARGGGGALRELAADARAVLDARSPPTGARLLALAPGAAAATIDPLTGLAVQGATTAGVTLGAGTQLGRRLAAGTTPFQRYISQRLAARGLNNTPLAFRQGLVGGSLSPTAQLVQEMLGIPRSQPAPAIIGLDEEQQKDALRAGLYQ